jgi:hypothetical protein
VPGEEIAISYLYFPPLTAADVNAGIKSDQGFAQQIPVLLQRYYPPWLKRLRGVLVAAGIIAIFYVLVMGARALVR